MTYIDDNNRVLIVAAGKWALECSYRFNAYTCQPNRSFQPSKYIGFYCNKTIDKKICKVLGYVDEAQIIANKLSYTEIIPVSASINELEERLIKLIKSLRDRFNKPFKCMILSEPKDSIILDKDILHDSKGAFTQGHRYVSLEKLLKAKHTSHLFD